MRLYVVIPAYNTIGWVGDVVRLSRKVTRDVIVVDDGSTDGTATKATEAGAEVLALEKNCGVGYASDTGIRMAFEKGAALVATVDADGSHDPREIPKMVRAIAAKRAAICLGNRFKEITIPIPTSKLASNCFASTLITATLGSSFGDVACGLRLFSSQYLDLIPRFKRYAYLYEIIYLAHARKLRIAECPVSVRYDTRRPLLTRRDELYELLRAVSLYNRRKWLRSTVSRLQDRVRRFRPFEVSLLNRRFAAFPIREYNAYLFQMLQSHWVDTG